MIDSRETGTTRQPVDDLAAEAERGRSPRTPFLALTGVWLVIFAVAAALIAVALTVYFVSGGS